MVTARGRRPGASAGGFWIRVGALDEGPHEAGISHFLEHVAFLRGSAGRSPSELNRLFDEQGAVAGAATSIEATAFSAHCLTDGFGDVMTALAELVTEPRLDGVDLERGRILDEIASYEDDDEEAVDALLQRALYGGHPLGRRPFGSAETVEAIDRGQLVAWHDRWYVPTASVFAAAGEVEHDRLVETLGELWPGQAQRLPARTPPPAAGREVAFESRPMGQFQLLLAAPAPSEAEPGFHATKLLLEALGGASSSRLWTRLAEELGLVYGVGAYQGGSSRAGQAVIDVAMRARDLDPALAALRAELDRLATEPLDEAELRRAHAIAKASFVLGPRTAADEQDRLGHLATNGLPLVTLEDEIAALDRVTLDEVRAAAAALDPTALTIAAVGPDEDAFRAAVAAHFATG